MSRFDFTNPGAVANIAIAKLLTDREEERRQQEELDLKKREADARIASQQQQDKRADELQKQMEESRNIANAANIRAAMARGDMLTPEQMDTLKKGHLESTYDQFGGKKLDSTSMVGGATAGAEAPIVAPMQQTSVQGTPDASVGQYGIAKPTQRDLERDAERETREQMAAATLEARNAAQRQAQDAARERADADRRSREEIAALRAGTSADIAAGHRQDVADRAAEKKADKEKEAAGKQKIVSDMANETLNTIDQLLVPNKKTGDYELAPGVSYLVGRVRVPGVVGSMFSDNIAKAQAALDNLKGRLVVDLIGEMKAQSRTGATGFGQLSDKERVLLENSVSRLKTNLGEKDFLDELKRLREKTAKIVAKAPIDFQEDK